MRVVTFRVSSQIKLVLALWCLGEILAFAIVAKVLGIGGAILLGVVTSFVGFVMLKRAGNAAMLKLRAAVAGRGPAVGEDKAAEVIDDVLVAAGALILVLPGFLSDIVGLSLLLPALRGQVARWVGKGGLAKMRGGQPSGPATIDLERDQWQRADPSSPPITKGSKAS